MALFNEQTNLSGQGNFAPGVTYYAGIKAPRSPNVTLPKSDASFNIDLSRIGDAMIAAKESETRLGLAAVEMEQNLQQAELERKWKTEEAEKDRQLNIQLKSMEDARMRELAANKNALDWQIANLNNATELEKLKYTKSAAAKDYALKQAETALLENKEMQDAFRDYQANPTGQELTFQTTRNRIISEIAREYGVLPSKLQTVASNAGWNKGVGSGIDMEIELQKKYNNDQYEQDKAFAQILSPSLYSQNPQAAVAQASGLKQRVAQVNNWREIYLDASEPEHIRDWARNQVDSNVGNIALDIALNSADRVSDVLGSRAFENPGTFIDTMKQIASSEIVNATGLGYNDVRPVVDTVYHLNGIDSTLNTVMTEAESNTKFKQNVVKAIEADGTIDILRNGSEQLKAAMIVGSIPLFQSLDPDKKRMFSDIIAGELFGRVYPYTEPSGESGYQYSYRGATVSYNTEQLRELGKELGMDLRNPAQIAAIVGSQLLRNQGLKRGVENGIVLQKDAMSAMENTLRAASGNPNPELTSFNMSPEDQNQQRDNILHCVENGGCNSDDIMSNIDTWPKGSTGYNKAVQYGRMWEAETRLGRYFNTQSEAMKFNDDVNYIANPSNIKGEDVAKFFGADYSKDPDKWDHYDLKNTRIYYTIEDGVVKLKYKQDGWLKTGGTELQERMNRVSNTLVASGNDTPELQLAFYKAHLGNVLETGVKDSMLNKALTKAQEVVLEGASKLDTKLLSILSKDEINFSDLWLKKGELTPRVKKDIAIIKSDMVENPTGNPFNEEQYPFGLSNVLSEIVEEDGIYYIRPTLGDISKHFGGYSSLESAMAAENVQHAYLEAKAQQYQSEEKHKQWLENQPRWKKLLEELGLVRFKEQ